MGYAYYDTPMGPAGYSVEDTCHLDGCERKIDRGIVYLCGNSPGRDDEFGCGRWFCFEHLMTPVDGCSYGTCASCWDFWERDHADGGEPRDG